MCIKIKEPVNKLWWHDKFIVFPKIIENQWVFLETVQARLRSGFYDE